MTSIRTSVNHSRFSSRSVCPGFFHRRPLRVIAGVDWSGDSLAGVRAIASLYVPDELVLVHAVPSSSMESRARSDKVRPRARFSGEAFQQRSIAAGKRSLTWVSALVHNAVPSTTEVCDVGAPAAVLLDTARAVGAELIVVGQRGARENLDGTIGSVSHEVCLNAGCSTLVVRKGHGTPRRVLALIQQGEDVIALQRWLRAVPFREPTDLTVLCLMRRPVRGEPIGPLSVQFWNDAAMNNARSLLDSLVRDFERPPLRVTGRVVRGDPASIVLREGLNFDLLMLHGSDRKGRDPGRSGLPWRALLRLAPCSTLIVRAMSRDRD
jgi:nucleotide-binding universal stress UspA family protein